jgi:hypothetical protein
MSIVLVYLGVIPTYARECVQQIKTWTSLPIYFITDNIKQAEDILSDYDITYIDSITLDSENLDLIALKRSCFSTTDWLTNRENLFFYSLLRLYIIEAFMKEYNKEDVFHLELDNLIYGDPISLLPLFKDREVAFVVESKTRVCAAFCYFKTSTALCHINREMINMIAGDFNNEMDLLGKYVDAHPENIFYLPHFFPNGLFPTTVDTIFDGNSIGMLVAGLDGCHNGYTIKKGKNPWVDFSFEDFRFGERQDEQLRRYWVIIDRSGVEKPLFNIHVHTKYLKQFLSMPFIHPSNRKLITSSKFQDECEMIVNVNSLQTLDSRHIHIKDIPHHFNNPGVVYLQNTERVAELLTKFKNPFALLAHSPDEWYPNNVEVKKHLANPKLVKYYTTNLLIEENKANFLPLGLPSNNCEDVLKKVCKEPWSRKPEGVYCFIDKKHNPIRQRMYNICIQKGLTWDKEREYEDYLRCLKHHKYALCPGGIGPDTHLFWECVYLGVIPIVENSQFYKHLRPYYVMAVVSNFEVIDIGSNEPHRGDINNLTICLPTKQEKLYHEDFTDFRQYKTSIALSYLNLNSKDETACEFVSTRGIAKLCRQFPKWNPDRSVTIDLNIVTNHNETIYLMFDHVDQFAMNLLDKFTSPIVLVTGNSDHISPTDFLFFEKLITSNIITRWFTQNCILPHHPKVKHIPIGLDYHTLSFKHNNHEWGNSGITPLEQEQDLKYVKKEFRPLRNCGKKAVANFQLAMDDPVRRRMYRTPVYRALKDNPNIVWLPQQSRIDFWKSCEEQAFVVSPPGNGLDTHRTWEVLALGRIPIVWRCDLNVVYDRLPIIEVDDWSELTEEWLNARFDEVIDKIDKGEYDYSRLSLQYWHQQISTGL